MTTQFSSDSRHFSGCQAACCASLRISPRQDAALILAVSLRLLSERIILPIT